jgi:hypothetical protein
VVPNIDTFIVEEFSKKGMENIYGKEPKVQKLGTAATHRKAVDCKCSTHFVKIWRHEKELTITVFVLVGYEEGYKFNDGTSA